MYVSCNYFGRICKFYCYNYDKGHNKNYHCCQISENNVLDESQYGESNGSNRFSIGRSMTKLCVKS